MKSVNLDYLKYIQENNFLEYGYRIEVYPKGSTKLEYDGDIIQSIEINGTESSSGFSIGETLSLKLSVTLLLNERVGERIIPTNSKIVPYVIYSWYDENQQKLTEETCMGIFYVDSVEADNKHKVRVSAVDAMSATEVLGQEYLDPQIYPPINSRYIVEDIVNKFPEYVTFDISKVPSVDVNSLVFNEYVVGKPIREILGYIAAIDGGFARVVENNGLSEIQFTRYNYVEYEGEPFTLRLTTDNGENDIFSKIKTIKSGTNKFNLERIGTSIYVKNEEVSDKENTSEKDEDVESAYAKTSVFAGSNTAKPYETVEFECPIIASSLKHLEALDRVFSIVENVSYYPIDATIFGYHFLECGDIIKIENTYGEILDLYIQDIKLNLTGGVTLTVSSKYDYNKSLTLKNSVSARVDSLTKKIETFTNNFEVTKEKIDMAVSKTELESIFQENIDVLNLGVNSWIREAYNLDGYVDDLATPSAVHFQGKISELSDIFKEPEDGKFPALLEFQGPRTTRFATCVKVNQRTAISILVRQGLEEIIIPEEPELPEEPIEPEIPEEPIEPELPEEPVNPILDEEIQEPEPEPEPEPEEPELPGLILSQENIAVYVNSEELVATKLVKVDDENIEGTEYEGFYVYNTVLNAGWNVIEVMHYETIGAYPEVKCARIEVGDINVMEDITSIDCVYEPTTFVGSPLIDLVNCNALSINYTRFVGAEFTIESDAISQVVTELKENTRSIGNLTTSYNGISARVEETTTILDTELKEINQKYTEINNTAEEIRLIANNTSEKTDLLEGELEGFKAKVEKESELYVKSDEIGTVVKEEVTYQFGDLEANYAQKSELQQTKTDITMSFSQSGGYNLIEESAFYNDEAFQGDGVWKLSANGNKLDYLRVTYENTDDLGYPDPNANTLYLPKIPKQEDTNDCYLSQTIKVTSDKTYTFSVLVSSHDTEKWSKLKFSAICNGSTVFNNIVWQVLTDDNREIEDDPTISLMGTGGTSPENWTKCKATFKLPAFSPKVDEETGEKDYSCDLKISLIFNECKEDANISIAHPLLVEGEYDMVYSPNSNEMYTGITRINKDGIKISRSDSTISTVIDHKGMTIVNDQAVLAEFQSDNAYMPVARIDKVVDSPIASKMSLPNTLTVNSKEETSDTNFRTLQECFNAIPDITTSTINIEVLTDTNGAFLKDRSGSPIDISIKSGIKVGSPIVFSNINNGINLHSSEEEFESCNLAYVRGIVCANCHNIVISYLNLDELAYPTLVNDLGIGVDAYTNISTAIILEHSDANVKHCNILNTINQEKEGIDFSCIVAARSSRCIVYNIRGNTSSADRVFVRYVYVSLGYSHLYISRHNELLQESGVTAETGEIKNYLPYGIKLIKFPSNEANLTTFTNREYEGSCPHDYLDSLGASPDYGSIREVDFVYPMSRTQETRYFDKDSSKYIISATTKGGSNIGTVRRNNNFYYDRTIFEYDPSRFKNILHGAQTKVYDENGNPINGESAVTATLIVEVESVGNYIERPDLDIDKFVPATITMYSDLSYAYDTSAKTTADPLFNKGVAGMYDYIPSNTQSENTIYLENNDYTDPRNCGFYRGNMIIEIPITLVMENLNSVSANGYKNGTDDLKKGKARYVIIDTGLLALDEQGNNIQGDVATAKIKNVYFKLEYDVNKGSTPGDEANSYIVPDYSEYESYIEDYREWTSDKPINFSSKEEYSATIPAGVFSRCNPAVNTRIYAGQTLTVYTSKGPDPSGITVTVPDYLRQPNSLASYKDWAEVNGIKIGNILYAYDNDESVKKECIKCNPAPGTKVYIGSTIVLTVSLGPEPKSNSGIEGLENASFPVYQRRFKHDTSYVFNFQSEYLSDAEIITFGADPEQKTWYYTTEPRIRDLGSANSGTLVGTTEYKLSPSSMGHGPYPYNNTMYARVIHKFVAADFISLLSNATAGSIQAEIIISSSVDDKTYADLKYDQEVCDKGPYQGQAPFRIDINSSLETIYDNPAFLTGKTDGISVLESGSNVYTIQRLKYKTGRRIPITFESGGENNFKTGKLKYVVLDSYLDENNKSHSHFSNTPDQIWIDITYMEAGVKKWGSIFPVTNGKRPIVITTSPTVTNQTIGFSADDSAFEDVVYDDDVYEKKDFYSLKNSIDGIIGENEGIDEIGTSIQSKNSAEIKRNIFKFDINEIKRRLPESFSTGYYSYGFFTEYQEDGFIDLLQDEIVGSVAFAFPTFKFFTRLNPSEGENSINEEFCMYSRINTYRLYKPTGASFEEDNGLIDHTINPEKTVPVGLVGIDNIVSGLSDYIYNGYLKYVIAQPVWCRHSYNSSGTEDFYPTEDEQKIRIKSIKLVVNQVDEETPINAASLAIEPWYLDED